MKWPKDQVCGRIGPVSGPAPYRSAPHGGAIASPDRATIGAGRNASAGAGVGADATLIPDALESS
ncbi:hypothetical protein Snoj_33680 [Streptomyces nojiriensis]|uniref:Uncharacterized protein n=1 Tax=Streptomyces nojiriensis TaxID=66374 RepID=A0ABQ3SNR0_9ACTN|nr:hypothetical protein JYK04_00777 [Streptomyces nojiriensis]GGS30390.1 hypothetical protein GCM10010205_70590 [Streptomyces nojiriensis]GHI69450.1 hypothetical protein Snoj_33680 [Streptomyces nojiriensis]